MMRWGKDGHWTSLEGGLEVIAGYQSLWTRTSAFSPGFFGPRGTMRPIGRFFTNIVGNGAQ